MNDVYLYRSSVLFWKSSIFSSLGTICDTTDTSSDTSNTLTWYRWRSVSVPSREPQAWPWLLARGGLRAYDAHHPTPPEGRTRTPPAVWGGSPGRDAWCGLRAHTPGGIYPGKNTYTINKENSKCTLKDNTNCSYYTSYIKHIIDANYNYMFTDEGNIRQRRLLIQNVLYVH